MLFRFGGARAVDGRPRKTSRLKAPTQKQTAPVGLGVHSPDVPWDCHIYVCCCPIHPPGTTVGLIGIYSIHGVFGFGCVGGSTGSDTEWAHRAMRRGRFLAKAPTPSTAEAGHPCASTSGLCADVERQRAGKWYENM